MFSLLWKEKVTPLIYVAEAIPMIVRIANNSTMSHYEAIEDLKIEINGVPFIIHKLWATDQSALDLVIGNNFQRLYSPFTQTLH